MSMFSSALAKIGISKDFQRKVTKPVLVGAAALAGGALGAAAAKKFIPDFNKPKVGPALPPAQREVPPMLPPPTAKLEPVARVRNPLVEKMLEKQKLLGVGGFRGQLLLPRLPRLEPSRTVEERPVSLDVNRDRTAVETEAVVTPPAVLRAQGDTPLDPATMLQDGGGMKKWWPLIAIVLLLVALLVFSRKK